MTSTPSTAGAGPLSYAIFQLARAHRARAGVLLRRMNLHPGQELLLMQLLDRDGQSQSELLEAVGLDHSSVSKSVTRMQAAGLVTRAPAPEDRRVMVVHLTDKGRALRGPLSELWKSLEELTTADLTDTQVEEFVRSAGIVLETINGAPADPEDSPSA